MKIWQRRTLGILALGGGALGATICTSLLFQDQPILAYVFILAGFAVYCWGVWCGVKMLESNPDAVRSNRNFWAIQIPAFQIPLLGYTFSCGALLDVYVRPSPLKLGVDWFLGSRFNYSLLQPGTPTVFSINLFALAMFLFLLSKGRAAPSNVNPTAEVGPNF